MKHPIKKPSAIFSSVIAQARDEAVLDATKAAQFQHTGIRGDPFPEGTPCSIIFSEFCGRYYSDKYRFSQSLKFVVRLFEFVRTYV